MRLSRFVACCFVCTCVCLLYVYQQSEIFRLGYQGRKRMVSLEDLLDKNTVLRYNIRKSASLICIGNKVCQGNEFAMPETYHMVKMEPSVSRVKNNVIPLLVKENILGRFFEIKRQAEAQTINTREAFRN